MERRDHPEKTDSTACKVGTLGYFVGLGLFLFAAMPVVGQDERADEGLRHLQAVEAAFRRAIRRAEPSIVAIFLVSDRQTDDHTFQREGGPDSHSFRPSGMGSGVIIDKAGYILTCYHVVRAITRLPSYELVVRLSDGRVFRKVRILAADPRSDLAVIQLLGEQAQNFTPITLADGGKLFRGQHVLALGNPQGVAAFDGAVSASWGIVSAIHRRAVPLAQSDEERLQSLQGWGSLVQTDCRLNTGVSGGALINLQGEMVGITVALSASLGLETPGGFAIPTDELTRQVISTLRAGREMEYGFLGILPENITADQARERAYLPVDGVMVAIDPNPGARRCGLERNDIIIAINGKPLRNRDELVLYVGSFPAGTELDVEVVRGIRKIPLKVRLGKYPVRGESIFTVKRRDWSGLRVDFLSTLRTGQYSSFEAPDKGVVVREVEKDTVAERIGLSANQVITHVNGTMVDTPDEFDKEMARANGPARLTLVRRGTDPGPSEIILDLKNSPAK